MKKVTEVSKEGAAVLVQWLGDNGSLQRGIVPGVVLHSTDGELWIDDKDLDASIPYGDPLNEILPFYEGPFGQMIVDELHRHGIWFAADILSNHDTVRGVLLKVFNLSGIFRRAREYQRR